jgi:cell wall-associated NlpC family hydrolase
VNARASLVASLTLVVAACATPVAGRRDGPVADRMVGRATAMLGQPYQFGGAAPGGFDCSGLVVYAADGVGIRLPRTARQQMRAGVRIARRNIRAGDLVFLHLAHKELHVGIALDAERFVHAPSTGSKVRIDSLAAAPYARGYIEARRVIDAGPPR